jgi:hypothetical protein
MKQILERGTPVMASVSTEHGESLGEIDAAVDAVYAKRSAWAETPPAERVELLERMIADTLACSEAWVNDACAAKGHEPDSVGAGEEWISGPALLIRNMRLLRDSLRDLAAAHKPRIRGAVRERDNGQLVAEVFPTSRLDKALWAGYRGEIWMAPGVSAEDLPSTQALLYNEQADRNGALALVLGAGNIACLGPRDALSKLFVDNRVVVLKTNPVNAYLRVHWERAFAALIERDFLAVLDGGPRAGAQLAGDRRVEEIHLTGSDKTHDAIVFGTGEQGRTHKQRGEPQMHKPITSELGNVSPVIVVPGPWSAKEIAYQGENIASMLIHNAGFNCLAIRALLTSAGWAARGDLLQSVRSSLAATPNRDPYYPGAAERHQAFRQAHPEAESFGESEVPWTLIADLDPDVAQDICFTTEAFCGTFGEVALSEDDPVEFLARAVQFCNEKLWGTLCATILIHPRSLKDPRLAAALEQALSDLRYGGIAVNTSHALNFAATVTTWGGYPGHTLDDIQSGRGVVGNTLMFSRPQKSVVHGKWCVSPKPPWFPSTRAAVPVCRRITRFEAAPSWGKLPGVIAAALRS